MSNLADNLAEGIHKIKWKYGYGNKKQEACWIKYKYWECYLEYQNVAKNYISIVYKCFCHNKN